jgi:hypothetical protein
LLSHGASIVSISAGTEPCPVCLEDFTDSSSMVALACGHVFCIDDFKRIGGKIGQYVVGGSDSTEGGPSSAASGPIWYINSPID